MSFLSKKIFNNDSDIFGLDLSDFSIKVVKIEDRGNSEHVVSYASCPLSNGCMVNGEIQKKDQIISVIKKVVSIAGPKKIKTKKVICSLPETKAFLRIVSLPQMNDLEMEEAIKWEIEASIPLTLDQVYYDWQKIPQSLLPDKNKINILVVAIAKSSVDQTIEVLESAGLNPVGLEIESIAQARSLLDEKDEKSTIMIVDIGDCRTSFSITKGGLPCFTSSIPLCGQTLTDAIAKGMKISFEEAEKIKIAYGLGKDFKNGMLLKLQQPVLENLAQEIERSIDFYLTGLRYSENIDRIILCGGGANTKGLLVYLAKKLGREIEMGDSWTNIKMKKNIYVIEKNQSIQYSTAIGLALKGAHYEDIS